MKNIIILFLVVAVIVGAYYLFLTRLGDVRPSMLPVAKSNKTNLSPTVIPKKGGPINGPLQVPSEFQIGIFAENLGKARDLAFTPSGTLLVSDSDGGRVIALPDKNQDGVADEAKVIIDGLVVAHGIAFYKGDLYVASETMINKYNWNEAKLYVSNALPLLALPGGGRHTTRTIVFDNQGKLYISLGSTCDVCFEQHPWIAKVLVSDYRGKTPQVYSSGLRNAVFITLNTKTQKVWATEMGRDFLGDNLPPDEVNILQKGGDYGWPVCYGNKVYDSSFGQRTADYCKNTVGPVYEIPAHSAPLGLTFINSSQFPQDWQGDLFVAYHGSWNRTTPIGYKIVRLNVEGETVGESEDFLTGFLEGAQTFGRPVDMEFDRQGYLYISDDKRGVVYIVSLQ